MLVFFPDQLQSQMAMLLQLLMNGFPIRLRPLLHCSGLYGLVPKQLCFQFFFAPAFRQRPTDSGCHRPFQILVDRAQPHSATACDLALPQPQLEPQPQNLFDFPHGLSPGRHPVLLA